MLSLRTSKSVFELKSVCVCVCVWMGLEAFIALTLSAIIFS